MKLITKPLLEGKNIFLTGGSRGIGKAAVLELTKYGANVAFSYVSSEAGAKDTVEQIKKINPISTINIINIQMPTSLRIFPALIYHHCLEC